MIYRRCKCGEHEAYGSIPPPRCSRCEKCGSDLATSPDDHLEPLSHDFQPEPVETDAGGAVLSRCRYCHRTRKQIAALAKGES